MESFTADLNKIHTAGKQLLTMINDLLDPAILHAAPKQPASTTADASALFRETVSGKGVLPSDDDSKTRRDIPVIMISALNEIESVVRCIEMGAEDYLPKPFDPVLLRARVTASPEKKHLRDIERLYAQSMEKELEIGRKIQSSFFPDLLPELPGWEIATFFQASNQVAGDFYDAFLLSNPRVVGLVVADVCDKGVGSALFMAVIRSLIRIFSGQTHLCDIYIQDNQERLEGITTPAEASPLDPANALIAVALTNDYIEQVQLEPGDILVGYTDNAPQSDDIALLAVQGAPKSEAP
jgi:serine phosphatase RsbU (regulator of sigma subunit)